MHESLHRLTARALLMPFKLTLVVLIGITRLILLLIQPLRDPPPQRRPSRPLENPRPDVDPPERSG